MLLLYLKNNNIDEQLFEVYIISNLKELSQ